MSQTHALRQHAHALAALRFDAVTDGTAALVLVRIAQAHVCALLAALPKERAPKPASAAIVDTSSMSDAEIFAHYKRTAPVEDLRFFLRHELSPELRARAEAISSPTPKDLASLRQAWRRERNAAELVSGAPVFGTQGWHDMMREREQPAELVTKS